MRNPFKQLLGIFIRPLPGEGECKGEPSEEEKYYELRMKFNRDFETKESWESANSFKPRKLKKYTK